MAMALLFKFFLSSDIHSGSSTELFFNLLVAFLPCFFRNAASRFVRKYKNRLVDHNFSSSIVCYYIYSPFLNETPFIPFVKFPHPRRPLRIC